MSGVRSILEVQRALNLVYVPKDMEPLAETGMMGTETANALSGFQRSRGLHQTGVPDRATVRRLEEELAAGPHGPDT